eukprot:UN29948
MDTMNNKNNETGQQSEQMLFEVRCRETFAYYPCNIVDYDHSNNKLIVKYDKDWKPRQTVDPCDVRHRPEKFNFDDWHPEEKQPVEAKARSEENEPFSWWPCTIRCIKNDFYLINFDGWNDQYNEILMKDMLRPYNTSKNLEKAAITKSTYKTYLKNNPRLSEWVESRPAELMQIHESILELYHMEISKKEITLLGSKKAIKRAKTLLDLILSQQKELLVLEKELRESETELTKHQSEL